MTRAVTGSKTAIVAIGNADSRKLMNVRAGSVSVEDEMDVENGAVDDVKEIGAEKNPIPGRWNWVANLTLKYAQTASGRTPIAHILIFLIGVRVESRAKAPGLGRYSPSL